MIACLKRDVLYLDHDICLSVSRYPLGPIIVTSEPAPGDPLDYED
jgi:hypothetical protein